MPSVMKIGPGGGPYVELDEVEGELLVTVPENVAKWGGVDFEELGDINGVTVENHNSRHESGGVDEVSVEGLSGDLADAQDPKVHSDTHGYDNADELAMALRYEPQSEPATPPSGCVRWYDNTDEAYKVKFDDGTSITVGEK